MQNMRLCVFDFPALRLGFGPWPALHSILETYDKVNNNKLDAGIANNLLMRIRARINRNQPFLPPRNEITSHIILKFMGSNGRVQKLPRSIINRFPELYRKYPTSFKGSYIHDDAENALLPSGIYLLDADIAPKSETYEVKRFSDILDVLSKLDTIRNVTDADWVNVAFNRGGEDALLPGFGFVKLMYSSVDQRALFQGLEIQEFLQLTAKDSTIINEVKIVRTNVYHVSLHVTLPEQVENIKVLAPGPSTCTLVVNDQWLIDANSGKPLGDIYFNTYYVDSGAGVLLLAMVGKIPYTISRVQPLLENYDPLVQVLARRFSSSTFIGVSAAKGSGKTRIIELLSSMNVIAIDSDAYGQVLTKMITNKVTLDNDDETDAATLAKLLNITANDGVLSITPDEITVPYHEHLAAEFLDKNPSITAERVLNGVESIATYRQFGKYLFSEIDKILKLDRYFTLLGFIRSALCGSARDIDSQKMVLFTHCSSELYPMMGDAYVALEPAFDSALAILTRHRQTSPLIQLFLYQYYRLIDESMSVTVPVQIFIKAMEVTNRVLNGYTGGENP